MKLILAIGIALTMAAGAALAQCPGCPQAAGCASMSAAAGNSGLAGLKLASLAGDTVDLSQHIGMMPMVMLLAGTGEASGKAADIMQAVFSALEQGPMLAYVLAAGPKPAKAFAKSHGLSGLVLVDQKRTALAAAMADTLPVALFINRSGTVVKADAKISAASVNEGVKALAQADEKLVDPVCGMTVTKETAAGTYVYKGQTYYFCSKACKDNFTKNPQKYLAQ
jgi:YHS domain-containing protein